MLALRKVDAKLYLPLNVAKNLRSTFHYLLSECNFSTSNKIFLSVMTKKLGVFDFDHTIVDDNTDVVVRKLLKSEYIPSSIRTLYKNNGWTAYMQEIFKLLHKYNIGKSLIKNAIVNIPSVANMKVLIAAMVDKYNFDVIIISDSNSIFINEWLIGNNMDKYITKVFTNPARYNENGLLKIRMYHVQNECKLSAINLCKGKIMEDFVKNQKESGIEYSQIVYVGDGKNDFCPILRLSESDLACVREGYGCADLVSQALEKKSEYTIKANVCVWKSGDDILKYLN